LLQLEGTNDWVPKPGSGRYCCDPLRRTRATAITPARGRDCTGSIVQLHSHETRGRHCTSTALLNERRESITRRSMAKPLCRRLGKTSRVLQLCGMRCLRGGLQAVVIYVSLTVNRDTHPAESNTAPFRPPRCQLWHPATQVLSQARSLNAPLSTPNVRSAELQHVA
jgi:hypothetical protein